MMQRTKATLLALILAIAGVAFAQTTTTTGTTAQTVEDVAWVRIVNVSPNAEAVTVEMRGDTEGTAVLTPDQFVDPGYNEASEYVQIPAGSYDVILGVDGIVAQEEGWTFNANTYSTIAVLGLVIPEAFDDTTTTDDGGFFGWLGGLFGGDEPADRDSLAIHLRILDDDLTWGDGWDADRRANTLRIRTIHAAPGSAPVDLVHWHADTAATTTGTTTTTTDTRDVNVLDGNVGFGEVSGWHDIDLTDTAGHFEIRVTDSAQTLIDLGQVDFAAGHIHTIFVTGTPVEEVPIEGLILSDTPVVLEGDTWTTPATTPATAPRTTGTPTTTTDPATGTAATAEDTTAATAADATTAEPVATAEGTLYEVASNQGDLTRFTEAIRATGLDQTLHGGGTYTVFAPVDSAWDVLSDEQWQALLNDQELLSELLMHHVVEGQVMSGDIQQGDQGVGTAGGTNLNVTGADAGVTVDGANVVEADLVATNGVIHKIDTVLVPDHLAERVADDTSN